ncbi:hypothetical protein METP3_00452 [Methanosarcinales archaeon]|nr:hypothetical protein METP3_00452 [Methanosarcinales archaeon]
MHYKCLPQNTQDLLKKLDKLARVHDLVLAGGTGLALQIGHRISVDLDYFTRKKFSTEKIFQELKQLGIRPEIQEESEGSITVLAEGTKLSIFHYPYPFVVELKNADGSPVAGIIDIASMKIIAISQRGAKRDFIDLYFILQTTPFWKIAENMIERFGQERINPLHIGKSLVFFDDAEIDPEPNFTGQENPTWKAVKKFFVKNVQQMVLDLEKAKSK